MRSYSSFFPQERDIPANFALAAPVEQGEYLIDGQLLSWKGQVKQVYSPVFLQKKEWLERKYLGSFPLLTETESEQALQAAVNAYDCGRGNWPTMSVEERICHIEQLALRMRGEKEQIVRLLMWEIGKSFRDSEREFDRTIEYISGTIEALKDLDRVSSRFAIEQGIIGQIRRAPLGVVLCLGPFNYPLNETFTTLIPALIMGNTVVFKPPKIGVLLYQPMLEMFRDTLPPGVINTVYGDGRTVIPSLMTSGQIDVLAFIGTSKVADILKHQHPKPHRLKSILGLDAKNAAVILQDADLELTVKECILGALSFNGQRCTAIKIIFIHESIADDFLKLMGEGIDQLKAGMPWDEGVSFTPLPEPDKVEYLQELTDDAEQYGAKIINVKGGQSCKTFFHPAVLYPVNPRMRIFHEEQFGPLIPVVPYKDLEQPLQYIRDSNYGQQVSIFGKNIGLIAGLIDPLTNQVCRVNLNSQCQRGPDTFPFTGRKDSAEGTLSVSDALRVFSIRSLFAAKKTDLNSTIIKKIIHDRKSNFLSTDFIF